MCYQMSYDEGARRVVWTIARTGTGECASNKAIINLNGCQVYQVRSTRFWDGRLGSGSTSYYNDGWPPIA